MTAPIAYQYKRNGNIILYINKGIITVGKEDVNYAAIASSLKAGDWNAVHRSLTVKGAIADHTNGRCQIFGDEIHIDNKPLPKAIASRVLTLFRKGGFNLDPVFRLLENIEANPEEFSRNELYLFLEQNHLPFTPDGHFLAYKMVLANGYDIFTGKTNLHKLGETVSMNRSDVDPDRNRTCSTGLHFCSYEYLNKAYSQSPDYRLLVLKINPADVVSIPSDYNNAKGRTWKYVVVEEMDNFNDSIPKNFTDKYSSERVSDVPVVKPAAKIKANVPDKKEEPNYLAKLSEDDVRKIRKMLAEEWSLVGIANTFGCSARQIARIRDGEAWADVK